MIKIDSSNKLSGQHLTSETSALKIFSRSSRSGINRWKEFPFRSNGIMVLWLFCQRQLTACIERNWNCWTTQKDSPKYIQSQQFCVTFKQPTMKINPPTISISPPLPNFVRNCMHRSNRLPVPSFIEFPPLAGWCQASFRRQLDQFFLVERADWDV